MIELIDINSDSIGDIVLKMHDVTKKTTGKNVRNQSFHPTFELYKVINTVILNQGMRFLN